MLGLVVLCMFRATLALKSALLDQLYKFAQSCILPYSPCCFLFQALNFHKAYKILQCLIRTEYLQTHWGSAWAENIHNLMHIHAARLPNVSTIQNHIKSSYLNKRRFDQNRTFSPASWLWGRASNLTLNLFLISDVWVKIEEFNWNEPMHSAEGKKKQFCIIKHGNVR